MDGFECRKCGGGNVEYLWDDFGALGKGITKLRCLNPHCENYLVEVEIYRFEIIK